MRSTTVLEPPHASEAGICRELAPPAPEPTALGPTTPEPTALGPTVPGRSGHGSVAVPSGCCTADASPGRDSPACADGGEPSCGGPPGPALQRLRTHLRAFRGGRFTGARGAISAEYAVVIIAAVAFAALLLKVIQSGAVEEALSGIIEKALS